MKLGFKKGQKGFTLVELMVVMAILAVLMGIVMPAVSGTKEASVGGQVASDAKSASTAVDNFSNKSITTIFPEGVLTSATGLSTIGQHDYVLEASLAATALLVDKNGTSLGDLADTVTNYAGSEVPARTALSFVATTDVYQENGSIKEAAFVPDFLSKEPDSLNLQADETKDATNGDEVNEFLWVLKVSSPGSEQESRAVEVYRCAGWTDVTTTGTVDTGDTLTYTQVY